MHGHQTLKFLCTSQRLTVPYIVGVNLCNTRHLDHTKQFNGHLFVHFTIYYINTFSFMTKVKIKVQYLINYSCNKTFGVIEML